MHDRLVSAYKGLQEGAYLFTVQATNGIGNVSQKSYSWTIDRTKPAAVARFRALARDKVVRLEWKKPIDVDYDHVRILRKRVGTDFWKTIATRASATALKDTAVQNDMRYRYRIQSLDHARNASAGAEVNGRPSKIYSPVFGAIRRSPPLIDWTPVRNATYYNVQVWRNGLKVLSRWPLRSSTRLRSRLATPDGRSRSLPVTTWSTPGQDLEGRRRPATEGCGDGPRSRCANQLTHPFAPAK